jgi:ElaB/YqjD/DUF883 family membrane-anchored ribosome-binding protein
MTFATHDSLERKAKPSVRVADAARHAAHLSHETRLIKSMAADAVQDGVYQARRAAKFVKRQVEDLGDQATYRIRRQPLTAVGTAFAAGIVLGGAIGWFGVRYARRAAF